MTTDWDAVQEHLDYLQLDPEDSPIVFRAWCEDFGRDFLKNLVAERAPAQTFARSVSAVGSGPKSAGRPRACYGT